MGSPVTLVGAAVVAVLSGPEAFSVPSVASPVVVVALVAGAGWIGRLQWTKRAKSKRAVAGWRAAGRAERDMKRR